jgi:hypothetical protein
VNPAHGLGLFVGGGGPTVCHDARKRGQAETCPRCKAPPGQSCVASVDGDTSTERSFASYVRRFGSAEVALEVWRRNELDRQSRGSDRDALVSAAFAGGPPPEPAAPVHAIEGCERHPGLSIACAACTAIVRAHFGIPVDLDRFGGLELSQEAETMLRARLADFARKDPSDLTRCRFEPMARPQDPPAELIKLAEKVYAIHH